MNTHRKELVSLALCLLLSGYISANENIGGKRTMNTHSVMSTGCAQDQGAYIFNVNNVRCRIMDEGDMWWDPGTSNPVYLVPANGIVNAQFAAALWIGGYDAGGQLKEAAMTYRQNGEDFWAGPIDTCTHSITPAECLYWDKMFYVTRAEVEAFVTGKNYSSPPADIANWPGNGHGYCEVAPMAPYVDVSNSGSYNPQAGDYPAFDLSTNGSANCQNELYGDACLWWVINDEGNIHSETGGVPIGLEIREQAFGFQTNDAINNMTFYHYQIINRSTAALYNTYFGFWDDFDLGNGALNYTGCDVGRNMGYGYCSVANQPPGTGNYAGEPGYLNDPAAVGVVFFQGPKADSNATEPYIKNGYIGMARFVYYNNDFTVTGNPQNQTSYYNYLTGKWIDGTLMTYGGTGYGGSGVPCSYMFPYTPGGTPVNTDPHGYGTGGIPQGIWDEVQAGDAGGDRRFLESAGPFTLTPGAVNYVIVGCVWDQPSTQGLGNIYPIQLIQQDADLAQGLFNNCFRVVNGPDAPQLTIQALDQELILTISNPPGSNNYREHYAEKSPTILPPFKDTDFVFQGYEIFQVIDSAITAPELLDPTKARLIAQCDVKDSVAQIVNYIYNSAFNDNIPTLEVSGANKGIVHSFDIKSDAFQQDNESFLVNDRPYYYMAIAYAFNNYLTYIPSVDSNRIYGQKLPFLQGRLGPGGGEIPVYTAIPNKVNAERYGTVQNSVYGSGVPITRLEGHGNGSNVIELDQASINYILANDSMAHPTYVAGQGPITVKVVDPLSVVNANFIVKFIPGSSGVNNATDWELINQTTGEVFYSDTNIGYQNEQVFPQYGISVSIVNVPFPGGAFQGAIDSSCSLTFANPEQNWLTGVASASPGVTPTFWIRSGSFADFTPGTAAAPNDPDEAFCSYGPAESKYYDPQQYYNQVLGGLWAPYGLCAVSSKNEYCDNGPAFNGALATPQLNTSVSDSIGNIASVDIVFTADQSKWSRCVVFEEQDATALSDGHAAKMDFRNSYSIDQNGNFAKSGMTAEYTDPSQPNYISPTGMGWFPGYAINVETGERLNVAYGEDSWLTADSGRDMKWDPDATVYSAGGSSGSGSYFGVTSAFGGKHYIYVFGHNNNIRKGTGEDYSIPAYDACQTIYTDYLKTNSIKYYWRERVLNDVMWVGIPLLNTGHKLLECDATVRLRVAKPYDTAYGESYLNGGVTGAGNTISGSTWRNPDPVNNNFPMFSFTTSGLETSINNNTAAQNALSLINVVPNPYYAYSGYESSALDTRVRITNLPPVCTISIFTLSGTLIAVINKNNPQTYTDWNLMNQYNVPIASGLYLIHVAVPDVGEVTLKWFGVMRPLDLTTY